MRVDLVSETFASLRDLIVTGRLAPGTTIVERVAAERLGVSRGTIRSALQRLVLQGYVLASPLETYSRAVVAPVTVDDMADLYTLIGALDGIGASRAAGLEGGARARLVGELAALNEELLRVSRQRRSFDRVYELDAEFHRRYIAADPTPRLIAQYNALTPHSERYGRMYASALIDEIGRSVAEHAAIVDAIAAGDAEGAERCARANWRNAVERFRPEMAMLPEQGTW